MEVEPQDVPAPVETEAPAESNGHADEAGSVRDLIRRRRAAALQQRTVDFDVPGYGGTLKVRYQALGDDLADFVRKWEKVQSEAPGAALASNCDLLIKACQAILVPESADDDAALVPLVVEDGELAPQSQLPGGEPVHFDQHLAEWLDLKAEKARGIVLATFGTAPQPDMAVGEQAQRLLTWFRGVEAQVDDQAVDFS